MQSCKLPNISERMEAESWHQLLPRLRASLHDSPGIFLPCKSQLRSKSPWLGVLLFCCRIDEHQSSGAVIKRICKRDNGGYVPSSRVHFQLCFP